VLARTTNDDARRLYGALQQQHNPPEQTPSYAPRSSRIWLACTVPAQ
jgi:hypothetical protein